MKHGSVEGRDAESHTNQLAERSTPPPLPDIVDPNMCYVPNAYASIYYGGEFPILVRTGMFGGSIVLMLRISDKHLFCFE